MGCLTTTESVQFPLLSRTNPGRYVKDVEVDTDTNEAPASTPPARPRADDEPRGARASRKRKWDGEADQSQREVPTAPVRRRANHEPASRPKQKARKLVLPASNADTGRAADTRNSPSSEEDVSAKVLGRSADLPAPKARTPSEEARRPLGQGRRHAATANMPVMEKCLPSEQVPFDDSPSGQEPSAHEQCREEPSAQRTLGQAPSAETPSAQKHQEQVAADEGREKESRVPSAVAVRAGEAGPPGASSSTPLEVLAGRRAEVAAEEAAQLSSRESPRISTATKILEIEDDTASEEEEVESVRGFGLGSSSDESPVDSTGPEVPAARGALRFPAGPVYLSRKL
ncbi:hypothetical protein AXG93_4802s1000 [Marchantia polymorpha subsp. ruderalis]|uniref:Uncharacterized protein n=1 Tax=Marchantia polymorpha subsp. ruderalis TaxID=1480154 RepID=A0A176WJ79_MARPO|nr:hypothetical protein AXG93_4802s1000 [Marchantia polymorpha subsp. ruderalis]